MSNTVVTIRRAIATLLTGPETEATRSAIRDLEQSIEELRRAEREVERHTTRYYGEPRLDTDIDDPLGLID
jgi:hypothetical protein